MESNNRVWMAAAVLGLAAAGIGIYFHHPHLRPPTAPSVTIASEKTPPEESKGAAPVQFEQSDEFIRQSAQSLAPGSRLAGWLKTDNILRRITAAAQLIAAGKSPRDSLSFLAPEKKFVAKKKNGKLYIDPRSYARYDPIGDAFESLNAAAAVSLFQELKPLFQQICREIECTNNNFQDTLVEAIRLLLRTPVPQGDVLLQKKVVSYAFADPKPEGLSAAQKHLLRMGPTNAAKIQAKLREILQALGVQENQPADSRLRPMSRP